MKYKNINPRPIWLGIKSKCPYLNVIYRVGVPDRCDYEEDEMKDCCIEECPRLK